LNLCHLKYIVEQKKYFFEKLEIRRLREKETEREMKSQIEEDRQRERNEESDRRRQTERETDRQRK
jgi:hypothetical protein